MAAQMNYGYVTPKGVPGGKFDLADDVVASRVNEEADGVMLFGIVVAQGTSAGQQVKKPVAATTADKIDGVLLHTQNVEQGMDGKVVIKNGATVNVMKHGHVWGRIAEGVTPVYGAAAKVIKSGNEAGFFTTGEGLEIGATFGNASDNGIAEIILK